MKTFKKFCWALASILLVTSCQKDDICPEGTPTTPLLLIEFYDAEDPTRLKAVPNLAIHAVGEEELLLEPTTVNAVSIPLRTDQNTTEYRFIWNSGTEFENEDRVTFTYSPEPEYINRACGFRMNYHDLNVSREASQDNWILTDLVIQTNVENDTEAHISFTH